MPPPAVAADLARLGDPELTAARVLAQHTERWLVEPAAAETTPHLAPARGRLRQTTTPVTGDWVALDRDGAIAHVLERRGTIMRRAPGEVTAPQVLAAHVDLVLITEPLPEPNVRRAERIAGLAAAGDVPAAVVLTKSDRADDGGGGDLAAAFARRLGVLDGIAVSAHTGDGLGALRSLLQPDATAVLLGPSGAGKSSLVNTLLGVDRQATGAVRAEDDRGRHTTVTRELITLPGGALLVDTPGIREIGVWDSTEDGFDDIKELAAGCRFSDCTHSGEPDCAVAAGLDPDRLADWHTLQSEQAWVNDRRAAARAREQSGRGYKRVHREARWSKGDDS